MNENAFAGAGIGGGVVVGVFQASFRMVLGGDCAVISGIIVGHWCATGITRYVLTRF